MTAIRHPAHDGPLKRGRQASRPDDEIAVRAIAAHEAALFARLFARLLDETLVVFPAQALEQTLSKMNTDHLQAISQDHTWAMLGAFAGHGEPLGLCFGAPAEAGVGTVIWLLVDPGYQRRGIGRNLLAAASAHYEARGCHKIKLTAPTAAARDYYVHIGMQLEGFHPRHWWGVDFWSLGLNLSSGTPDSGGSRNFNGDGTRG